MLFSLLIPTYVAQEKNDCSTSFFFCTNKHMYGTEITLFKFIKYIKYTVHVLFQYTCINYFPSFFYFIFISFYDYYFFNRVAVLSSKYTRHGYATDAQV